MSELGSPREFQRKETATSEKMTGLKKTLCYLNAQQVCTYFLLAIGIIIYDALSSKWIETKP